MATPEVTAGGEGTKDVWKGGGKTEAKRGGGDRKMVKVRRGDSTQSIEENAAT